MTIQVDVGQIWQDHRYADRFFRIEAIEPPKAVCSRVRPVAGEWQPVLVPVSRISLVRFRIRRRVKPEVRYGYVLVESPAQTLERARQWLAANTPGHIPWQHTCPECKDGRLANGESCSCRVGNLARDVQSYRDWWKVLRDLGLEEVEK